MAFAIFGLRSNCSLIPRLGVKLSTIILAGPTVLSTVGACPPHDGPWRRLMHERLCANRGAARRWTLLSENLAQQSDDRIAERAIDSDDAATKECRRLVTVAER